MNGTPKFGIPNFIKPPIFPDDNIDECSKMNKTKQDEAVPDSCAITDPLSVSQEAGSGAI